VTRNVLSRRVFAGAAALAVAALALAGCGDSGSDTDTPGSGTSNAAGSDYAKLTGELKASGASFPNAFYQKALDEFEKVAPDLAITYNSTGSGTGKKEFGSGLTDFAGTDSTVKDGDGPKAGEFMYVPTVAAPITVSYNLPGVSELKLSAEVLAKIFQRDIKTWDDAAIKADNAGVTLPSKPIVVAHRSDGSGTTNNFTKYLNKAAAGVWKLGTGDTVAWPADTQGGDKNTGVAQLIKQSEGAIGYVDLSDATASSLVFASIKNKDGKFVKASLAGSTAALGGAEIKDDLSYDPLNAAGADSYPITAPTFILVKTKYDAEKGKNVKAFLKWLLTDGQKVAESVQYSKLPEALQTKALAQIEKIQA
jgi:phosphate transport system substrate-binding protein